MGTLPVVSRNVYFSNSSSLFRDMIQNLIFLDYATNNNYFNYSFLHMVIEEMLLLIKEVFLSP